MLGDVGLETGSRARVNVGTRSRRRRLDDNGDEGLVIKATKARCSRRGRPGQTHSPHQTSPSPHFTRLSPPSSHPQFGAPHDLTPHHAQKQAQSLPKTDQN
ncbi:hypothetical protein KC19_VG039300 [Ceratodon purpureus]|uniref:Uncharacterized protein n=1 Tax=Ceratodon purpureus TaxID=3225 RepID=A0A8T0HLT9_CERPU|nr:hypothetical protein KC19_VG039300 [Ceratodon purpureus]